MTAPAITEWTIESGTLALFAEWLGIYFDGVSHTVGNVAQIFPKAELRFQQSALPQPLAGDANAGLGISVVWVRPGKVELCGEWVQPPTLSPNPAPAMSRQQVAYVPGSLMFFVRAQGPTRSGQPEPGTGNAKKRAQDAAQLLFGLLQNSSATKALAQKGIHKVRAESPALVSQGVGSKDVDLNYATRLVSCRMRLRYAVISQPLI